MNEPARILAEWEIVIDLEEYLNQVFVHGKCGQINFGHLPDSTKLKKAIIADDNQTYIILLW